MMGGLGGLPYREPIVAGVVKGGLVTEFCPCQTTNDKIASNSRVFGISGEHIG